MFTESVPSLVQFALRGAAIAFRIAFRNLVRHHRRSLIAILSVGFGIAAFVVANGFAQWMFHDFREATIESAYGHLQITRPQFHEKGRADPFQYLLPNDADIGRLAGLPHVRRISPMLTFAGLISRDEATFSFIGEGISVAGDLSDNRSVSIVRGAKPASDTAAEIIVGQGLARTLGADVGSRIVLLVNTPSGGLSAVEAQVAGIFTSVSKSYDDSALLLPIALARRLLKVDGAHAWRVFLDDTAHTGEALSWLKARLDNKQFEVRPWTELAEFYMRAVKLLSEQLGVVRAIVVAIILLGIGNTMMMSVLERTSEIGTAMALGVKRQTLLVQFMIEGALIGLIGGTAGLLLAAGSSLGIGAMHIDMPPPPGLSRGYVANVMLAPSLLVEGMLIALITTTLASIYPAWKASRLAIVDALRHGR